MALKTSKGEVSLVKGQNVMVGSALCPEFRPNALGSGPARSVGWDAVIQYRMPEMAWDRVVVQNKEALHSLGRKATAGTAVTYRHLDTICVLYGYSCCNRTA